MLADIKASRAYDTTTLPVALREVRNLIHADGGVAGSGQRAERTRRRTVRRRSRQDARWRSSATRVGATGPGSARRGRARGLRAACRATTATRSRTRSTSITPATRTPADRCTTPSLQVRDSTRASYRPGHETPPSRPASPSCPSRACACDAEVPAEEVERRIQQAARELGRQMRIPGFRKGKVPPPVVIRRLGREAVLDEALRSLAGQLVRRRDRRAGIVPDRRARPRRRRSPRRGPAARRSRSRSACAPRRSSASTRASRSGRREPQVEDARSTQELERAARPVRDARDRRARRAERRPRRRSTTSGASTASRSRAARAATSCSSSAPAG